MLDQRFFVIQSLIVFFTSFFLLILWFVIYFDDAVCQEVNLISYSLSLKRFSRFLNIFISALSLTRFLWRTSDHFFFFFLFSRKCIRAGTKTFCMQQAPRQMIKATFDLEKRELLLYCEIKFLVPTALDISLPLPVGVIFRFFTAYFISLFTFINCFGCLRGAKILQRLVL